MVCVSKKRDIFVTRRLGALPMAGPAGGSDQELAAVFTGPLDVNYFSALRNIFSAMRAL
jgi:hypothetical protein